MTIRTLSGGISYNELRVKKNRADGNSVEQTHGGIVSAFPDIDPVLPYGGEGRGGVGADGDIVKADNAHGFRNPAPHLLALDEGGVCDRVLAADDGGDSHVQQAGKMPIHAFCQEKGTSCQLRGIIQPMAPQGLKECVIAHLHDMGFKRAAQISDFFMAKGLKV